MLLALLALLAVFAGYCYMFGVPPALQATEQGKQSAQIHQATAATVTKKSSTTTKVATVAPPAPYLKGRLIIHTHGANNLRNVQSIGKQDPYCRLTIGDQVHSSTVHEDGGATANWGNQQFLFELDGTQDMLHIRVMDKNTISDESIGRADININELIKNRSKTTYKLFDPANYTKEAGFVELSTEYASTK